MNTFPESQFDLNYSAEKVSDTVKALLKTAAYQSVEINEDLNTYKWSKLSGLTGGVCRLTISQIDENKTSIKISTMPFQNSKTGPAILSRIQDEFLQKLTNLLSGKEDVTQLKEAKKGCVLIFLLVGAAAVIMTLI